MIHLEPYIKDAKHVVWDWNGTLLNDLTHCLNTVNHFLKKHQLPEMDKERYKDVFGFPIRSYYQNIGFKLNDDEFEKLCHDFTELFMGGVFSCGLMDGAEDFLRLVKSTGRTQSVLSASDQDSLDKMITHFNLRPHLDHVFGIPDRLAASKVQRGRELIEHSGIDARDTVLFGDTDHDLEVGETLGARVVLVAHGHQSAVRLRKIHHTVIELPN
jgi:phosphoglycolate phosphatase